MKRCLMILALVVATPVFAAKGGEGNNTDCNGKGNQNSPCNQGGSGGAGGAGGMGLGIGVGVGVGVSEANAEINMPGEVKYRGSYRVDNNVPAPDVISHPTAPCRIGYSGSAAGGGVALGFGGSAMDEGCDTREDARLLFNMGLHDMALMRLCAKPEMAAVIGKCPKPKSAPSTTGAGESGAPQHSVYN